MMYKGIDLDKGLFVLLRQEPYKSRVYYNGEEISEVTKVEVTATPNYTNVVLHLTVTKIFTDADYTEIRTEEVKNKEV